jgi:hypothetical protein
MPPQNKEENISYCVLNFFLKRIEKIKKERNENK